ncbi:MAG: RimK family alpha-L-glutamate ligase [Thermodesulfobacteriota bacterium]|nr:RimK family alpha-L-glutamate ligase [Thermodesulfobacteriota bacterium]
MTDSRTVIALEKRLKPCRNVITLGVHTNFSNYSEEAAAMIREADTIYYPTLFYADIFDAMGKSLFPSYHTYKCVQDKIKQTAIMALTGIPHPRTRIYYGRRKTEKIIHDFDFPFVAKVPRGSAMGRGVFLIQDTDALQAYAETVNPAYIQEFIETDRDMRVVIIGSRVVHAYWRLGAPGEFRNNVAVGGEIVLDPLPAEAIDLALHTARTCQWNDVGIDIIQQGSSYYVIEANMKYGREGFKQAGINYYEMMEGMIANGEI